MCFKDGGWTEIYAGGQCPYHPHITNKKAESFSADESNAYQVITTDWKSSMEPKDRYNNDKWFITGDISFATPDSSGNYGRGVETISLISTFGEGLTKETAKEDAINRATLYLYHDVIGYKNAESHDFSQKSAESFNADWLEGKTFKKDGVEKIHDMGEAYYVAYYVIFYHDPKNDEFWMRDDEMEPLEDLMPKAKELEKDGFLVEICEEWVYHPTGEEDREGDIDYLFAYTTPCGKCDEKMSWRFGSEPIFDEDSKVWLHSSCVEDDTESFSADSKCSPQPQGLITYGAEHNQTSCKGEPYEHSTSHDDWEKVKHLKNLHDWSNVNEDGFSYCGNCGQFYSPETGIVSDEEHEDLIHGAAWWAESNSPEPSDGYYNCDKCGELEEDDFARICSKCGIWVCPDCSSGGGPDKDFTCGESWREGEDGDTCSNCRPPIMSHKDYMKKMGKRGLSAESYSTKSGRIEGIDGLLLKYPMQFAVLMRGNNTGEMIAGNYSATCGGCDGYLGEYEKLWFYDENRLSHCPHCMTVFATNFLIAGYEDEELLEEKLREKFPRHFKDAESFSADSKCDHSNFIGDVCEALSWAEYNCLDCGATQYHEFPLHYENVEALEIIDTDHKIRSDFYARLERDFPDPHDWEAESHAYSYAYNEGHTDSRKTGEYRPSLSTPKQEAAFKRILKQKKDN